MIDGLILIGAVAAGYFRLFQTLLWTSGCAMLAIAFFGHGSNLWGAALGAATGLWVDSGYCTACRSHGAPSPIIPVWLFFYGHNCVSDRDINGRCRPYR